MALTQISTQGIKDGTITGSDLATNVDLVDNQKLRLGTGNDLQIYHDGSSSFIDHNGTGHLQIRTLGTDEDLTVQATRNLFLKVASGETAIRGNAHGAVELYHDNSKKFETDSTGVTVTGILRADEIRMGDSGGATSPNERIRLGNSEDLQIYHDGSNSYIEDSGTGVLIVKTNALAVKNAAGDENLFYAQENVGVELFYNNSKKFETTSGGVVVTGDIAPTNHVLLGDSKKAIFGDGLDLQIYHSGSGSFIQDTGTGNLNIASDAFRVLNAGATENMITANENGAVSLYYDNSKKFETISEGAKIISTGSNATAKLEIEATNGGQPTLLLKPSLSGTNRASRIDFLNQDNTTPKWTLINDYNQNGTNDFRLVHFNENAIRALPDAQVELYYNNSKKFETTSAGAVVTGTFAVDATTGLGLPIGTDANEPNAANYKGYLRFNDDDDAVYFSNGTEWINMTATTPTLSSVSGNIFDGLTSNLTLSGTGFLSANLVVNFVQSSDGINANVTVTPSSDSAATVAVPSAVHGSVTAGNVVTIKVTNSDGKASGTVNKTASSLPSGGTITTSGGFRIHTFTSSGTFVNTIANNSVQYLVIGGGASGGNAENFSVSGSGGGGAGGYRSSVTGESSGGGASAESAQTLSAASFSVTVGGGGSSQTSHANGNNGSNSVFAGSSTITSLGGGAGGGASNNGSSGGSGGGGGDSSNGGAGTSGQGFAGANFHSGGENIGGGGGGAGAAATNANGGVGVSSSINGSATFRAGGGGGAGRSNSNGGSGGNGGGGAGTNFGGNTGTAGTANTGGGGGGTGAANGGTSGAGGSGIVILRYAI